MMGSLYFPRFVLVVFSYANQSLWGSLFLILFVGNLQVAFAEEFNVKRSSAAKKIEKYFAGIAPGGSADIEELVFDSNSLEVRGRVKVRASHSWGSINVPNPSLTNPTAVRSVDIEAKKTVTARFRYNLETNKVTGDVSLGRIRLSTTVAGQTYSKDFGEVRVDLDRIERILEGDWMAIVESIPNPGNVVGRERRNEYVDIANTYYSRHGKDNVFFASPRFVNWASPERLARWGAELVVTDGAAVKRIMNEARYEASKDQPEVIQWLERRGQQDARAVAQALLNGDRVQWPNITVQFQTVKYESRVLIGGRPVGPWVPVRHAAYVILWKSGSSGSAGTAPMARTVWESGNGIIRDEGQKEWIEIVNSKPTNRFTEVSRTDSYVELYDQSRGYSVRLFHDSMHIKGGVPGQKQFPNYTRLVDGRWTTTANAINMTRTIWESGNGIIRDEGQKKWVEIINSTITNRFNEVSRTNTYIELHDPTRNYSVRLLNDQMLIKGGNPGIPQFREYTKIANGRWITKQ